MTTETVPAFSPVDETVYVTGSQVNIRKSAGTNGAVITTVSKGTALKRTGYSDSWSRVIYQDQECYISSRFVSKEQPAPEPETAAPAVTGNGSGKIIALIRDTRQRALRKRTDWTGGIGEKGQGCLRNSGNATGIPEYKLTLAQFPLKLKEELLKPGIRYI